MEQCWIVFGKRPFMGKTRFPITGNLEQAAKAADELRKQGYTDVRFMAAVQPPLPNAEGVIQLLPSR